MRVELVTPCELCGVEAIGSREHAFTPAGQAFGSWCQGSGGSRSTVSGFSPEAVQAAARSMFDADDAYEAYEWSADVGAWYERMALAALAAAWATDFGGWWSPTGKETD